jgi:glutamate dehydrogenase
MHIFIDPNPNPKHSFAERKKLFHLPRSTWMDYSESIISKGGGVFSRSAKFIKTTPEMRQLLDITQSKIEPNDLIRAILRAKVDLLWNGGIGTYVKATHETHLDVGDRTNDSVRINATELRCKVVGEGGNLGFTQLARVEYDLHGGRIYTDFIDNSAGVDCSDHEVNIKILLNAVMANQEITYKQRNRLLASMTQQVANLVLLDNYNQTLAIDLMYAESAKKINLYGKVITHLEEHGGLNRALEFLPTEKELSERKAHGKGLTRPELAIMSSYCKILLMKEILATNLPEDPRFNKLLLNEFPVQLHKKYFHYMQTHPLHREIIATHMSNSLVNEMGVTFVYRLQVEGSANITEIMHAFLEARLVFKKGELWRKITTLDLKIDSSVQLAMLQRINRLTRRATRWFLHNRVEDKNIVKTIAQFRKCIADLGKKLLILVAASDQTALQSRIDSLLTKGVPPDVAGSVADASILLSALDIVQAHLETGISMQMVARAYFHIGVALNINWFRQQVIHYAVDSLWSALVKTSCRDDLDEYQRILTIAALRARPRCKNIQERVETWLERNAPITARWRSMIEKIQTSESIEPLMFSAALHELLEVVTKLGK